MSGIAIGLFFLLGLVLSLVGGIWGLVQAFQEDIVWGLLYFFVPFAALFFYVKKWSNLKIRKTFLIQCAGLFMFLLGGITTAIFGSADVPKTSDSIPSIEQGSNEQSPSPFPSDFNTSPSPGSQPKPSP
ncbi:hypothetical protein QT971_23670 [Microcoleus sp. herbarium19]|uniref:hypothetical protein n=1 Tax=unclassified Microcoleus TaxID=2642155 RepID=UPI002FD39AF9